MSAQDDLQLAHELLTLKHYLGGKGPVPDLLDRSAQRLIQIAAMQTVFLSTTPTQAAAEPAPVPVDDPKVHVLFPGKGLK